MSEIIVETGIPVPAKRGRPKGISKYPFAKMEIGQSFFTDAKIANVSAATSACKPLKIKVTLRTVTENGTKGVRCWRIA